MDKRFEEHEHEAALMQGLKDSLVIHNLPPVQLGSGRTSVGHKFQALMHMIKIVSPTLTLLPHCARSCVVLTSDYGVEARVPTVNRKFGFESHEQCYWNSGEYRVRCDQAGGKDTSIYL